MPTYTLYFAPDNASLVIRVVLEELGVVYDTVAVNRTVKEQESETYRKLNPNGLIPVCMIDGEPIFETAAIALILAERNGHLAPKPGDSGRPRFLKWLFFISNTIHPDLRQLFYPKKYVGRDKDMLRAHAIITRERLCRHFDILEQLYAGSGGPYIGNDTLSIVDIYAALCLRWTQVYPMSDPGLFRPENYPSLQRLLTAMQSRPAVARAFEAEGISAPYLLNASPPDGTMGSPV